MPASECPNLPRCAVCTSANCLMSDQIEYGERRGKPLSVRAVPSYQARVDSWVHATLGTSRASDPIERCRRFLEEALELVQAVGLHLPEAQRLLDYVYRRPGGEMHQELGGVSVTLHALANAINLDVQIEAERELDRCHEKAVEIRTKDARKKEQGI